MVYAAARPSPFSRYLALLVVLAIGGFVLQVRFLPVTEFGEDGFQSQLFRVLVAAQEGSLLELGSESPLLFVHVLRAIAVAPFLVAESFGGPPAQLLLLSLALMPLVARLHRQTGSVLAVLPLCLPLAISGRGVLVAAGVAYLVVYLLAQRASRWYLVLGTLWVMLSSASVLMALLLMVIVTRSDGLGRRGLLGWLAIVALAFALGASAADKIAGFQSGDAGYEANAIQSSNVILVALSRSTLVSSFLVGNYLRGTVYGLLSLYVVYKAAALMLGGGRREMRRIVLCCLPGVPMEGLGMLALIFPLLWLFMNYDPTESKDTGRRTRE